MLQRHARVVPLAVAGRAFDDRLVIGDAGLLRRLRDASRCRSRARSPACPIPSARSTRSECRRRRRSTVKPFCSRMPVRYFDGLELLEAELAEAEHLIDHLLRELRARIDVAHRLGLERGELRARRQERRLARRRAAKERGAVEDRTDFGWRCTRDFSARGEAAKMLRVKSMSNIVTWMSAARTLSFVACPTALSFTRRDRGF